LDKEGNSCHENPHIGRYIEAIPKIILINSGFIEIAVSSGGLKAIDQSGHGRLSISPCQCSFSLENHQKTMIPGSDQVEIDDYRTLAKGFRI
jgi:hypothetical protein